MSGSMESVEERLSFFSNQALPNSVKNIAENSKNLTPVIEYLEQAYLTAPDQSAQDEVESQAKSYLVDALTTVVGDINAVASNLEQFVDLQADAIDGLSSKMEFLKTKLSLCKEQYGTEKFQEYRDAVSTRSAPYSREVGEDEIAAGDTQSPLSSILLPGASLLSDLSAEETKSSEKSVVPHERVPLQSRLSRLDNVGICLEKEESKLSAKTTAVASSSVLRRSSYNKPGAMRRASQHQEGDDASSATGQRLDDDDASVTSQSTTGTRIPPPPRLSTTHTH